MIRAIEVAARPAGKVAFSLSDLFASTATAKASRPLIEDGRIDIIVRK